MLKSQIDLKEKEMKLERQRELDDLKRDYYDEGLLPEKFIKIN